MDHWIPVIATLLGILLGGIISTVTTLVALNREEQIKKRALVLDKLELTHEVARTMRQTYKETYGGFMQRLALGTSAKDESEGKLVDIDRLWMLVRFYSPSISPLVEEIEASRKGFGGILASTITLTPPPLEARRELMDKLSAQYRDLDEKFDTLLQSIAAQARKYVVAKM